MKKRFNTGIILAAFLTMIFVGCSQCTISEETPVKETEEIKVVAGVSRALAEEIETYEVTVEEVDIAVSKEAAPEEYVEVTEEIEEPEEFIFQEGYTTTRVNVRKEPSTEADILDVYDFGTYVEHSKFNDEWSIVKYRDSEAYIYSEYISNTKPAYNPDDLYLLTQLIAGEAIGCDDTTQLYVGSVALNRVKSESYPDTLKKVIFQKGQYACTWDGNFYKTPTEQCKKNALYLLENGSVLPTEVVYQAGFKQGTNVYAKREGVYFCY